VPEIGEGHTMQRQKRKRTNTDLQNATYNDQTMYMEGVVPLTQLTY